MTRALSGDSQRMIAEIAARHGFEPDAGDAVAAALIRSGGTMAQFSHPALGGMGQWSKGGMMMIGEMNNDRLKARVGELLDELSEAIQSGAISEEEHGDDRMDDASRPAPSSSSGRSWWPASLGSPSSTGSQNNSRYAVFPAHKRLAVEDGGKVAIYDTGDEEIQGASQQQGGNASLRFSTRSGSVRVEDLKSVGEADGQDDVGAKRRAGPASPVATSHPSGPLRARDDRDAPGPSTLGADPIETIRRLAALRDDGVLTEAEFSAKKAELLSRI